MSVLKGDRWRGADINQWSGERHESKWFPNSLQKHLIHKFVDSTSSESTSVYFEFHKSTGRVYRINNDGQLNQREIIIKLKENHVF